MYQKPQSTALSKTLFSLKILFLISATTSQRLCFFSVPTSALRDKEKTQLPMLLPFPGTHTACSPPTTCSAEIPPKEQNPFELHYLGFCTGAFWWLRMTLKGNPLGQGLFLFGEATKHQVLVCHIIACLPTFTITRHKPTKDESRFPRYFLPQ